MKQLRILGMLVLTALYLGSVQAQTKLLETVEAKPGEAKISYKKYELENGLTVYLHEDHSDPMVHVEVTYKVGSNREHVGISGFAHFFEHMMFQGSEHVEDEEHINIIQSAGGQMNGTTNLDRTNYFETVPSNMLETALWLEADRMGFLLPAVTEKKFEIQRDAVKNEKEQNIVNQPYVLPFVELYRPYLYEPGHPYSWSTIGYVDDLDRVSVVDLKNFFKRWYGPNNAILVVAGDINSDKTIKMIEKYFASIPKGPEVNPIRPKPVVKNTNQFVTFYDMVSLPIMTLYYPSVPTYHRDEAPLDILASLLGGGRNSEFYQRFVKSELALQATVSNPTYELSGEFQMQVVPNMRKYYDVPANIMQTMFFDSIQAVLKSFDPMQVKEEELERVKSQINSRTINVMESVQGKAGMLTTWERLQRRPFNIEDELERYNRVTVRDLKRVYDKYILRRGALVTLIYPTRDPEARTLEVPHATELDKEAEKEYEGLVYNKAKDTFDRSIHPPIPPAKPAVVPQYTKAKLDNGIQVIHTTHRELPKVTMYFTIKGGALLDGYDTKTLGLANLTAAMMEEGTQKHSIEEIEAQLDRLGSSISFSADRNSTNITVTSLTKNIDATLKILEEMLFEPAFKEEDLDRLKNQMEQSLRAADRNPSVLAGKAFRILTYGETILAASSDGYVNTIDNIDIDEIKEFYQRFYSPNMTTLTIVGDITMDEIKPKLSFLNKWEQKEVKIPEINEFPEKEETTIYIVDKPGATQSVIIYGRRMMPYSYKGDFYKTYIANYSLGGSFNSRINLNLREDKGWTYGARSSISGNKYPGTWAVSSSVKARATDSALMEIYKEIKKFYETGITPEELERTKRSLNQADALNYETSFEKAGYLAQVAWYDLPESFQSEQEAILNGMTVEEVNAIAKKYLNPDEMIIVIVGDEGDIKRALKKTGIGKVTSIDPNKIRVDEFDD